MPSDRTMAAPTVAFEDPVLARARTGDPGAFRQLVETHRDRAYALALRITGRPDDAEEVAQDAFVRAWRALSGFRGDASFGTWLHRIVARLALDRRQARTRRERRETPSDPQGGLPEPEDVPEDDRAAAGRTLDRLLSRLGDTQRAVVALYYLEDRSVAEVGLALDLPENTVKTHLARARTTLREHWEREERMSPR